jgi:ubiquinone/menaquinone biosynthesis C-methylase UbiE
MELKNSTHEQTDENKSMRDQMEKMAPSYDAYMRKATFGRERILRDMTVSMAGVKEGDSVLEVGCGTGTLTLAAKRQAGPSGKVVGIDVIPRMIELSKQKAAQANEQITFQLGSIDDIPFPENHFDVLLCSFMIYHMSETTRRKGLTEIHRVLKPNGRLLVLDMVSPRQPLPRAIAQMLFGGMLQHDLQDLLTLMEASGFSNIETGQAKFRVLGLSVLGFARGCAQKK